MHRPRLIIARHLCEACEEEARRAFPLETGGAFMGRMSVDGDFVVEHMIGPGPLADHRRSSFEPDAAYQWDEMARWHRSTAGTGAYLGDWHTHPRHWRGVLSSLDRQALAEILQDPRTQSSAIVNTILSGGRRRWRWTAYAASFDDTATVARRCRIVNI